MKADQGTIICCSRCNLNVPITRSTYENGKDLPGWTSNFLYPDGSWAGRNAIPDES